MSLSRMSRDLNDVVCVDHLHLDDITVFHIMDAATRYSSGAVVESKSISECSYQFEQNWIAQFWSPHTVVGDKAYDCEECLSYRSGFGSKFRLVPRQRHNKNPMESKHKVIRDIFIRLKSANQDKSSSLLAQQAIRISNDLYGNDVVSAHELAKGYTRPVQSGSLFHLPDAVSNAHDELIGKRKLNKILRTHAVVDKNVKEGDLVQVFRK